MGLRIVTGKYVGTREIERENNQVWANRARTHGTPPNIFVAVTWKSIADGLMVEIALVGRYAVRES